MIHKEGNRIHQLWCYRGHQRLYLFQCVVFCLLLSFFDGAFGFSIANIRTQLLFHPNDHVQRQQQQSCRSVVGPVSNVPTDSLLKLFSSNKDRSESSRSESTTATRDDTNEGDLSSTFLSVDSILKSISKTLDSSSSNLDVDQESSSKQQQIQQQSTNNNDDENDISNIVTTMMVLLFLVGSLSSLDRVAMSVALVPMSTEYSMNDSIKGSISSFFSVGYGLGIVPAGLILSQPQVSPRTVMACGIALWSIGTIATPLLLEQNMTLLLLARMLVGMSESVVIPTIQRLLSSWIPPDKKSAAVATIFGGFQTGTIMSYAFSPAIIDYFDDNWRSIFFVYGIAGLLYLIPWWLLAQDEPKTTPMTTLMGSNKDLATEVIDVQSTSTEGTSIENKSNNVFQDAPWKDFLTSKATWAMFLAHAANNWGLYNNLSWTPTFYAEQYGLNVKESAWLLILPSIVGLTGGLVSGSIADSILQQQQSKATNENEREANTTRIRRTFQGLALLGPALCLGVLSMDIIDMEDTPTMAQSLLAVAVGFQSFNAAGYGAANQEKAGPKYTGLLYSVTSLPSVMIGTVGVQCTGWILDATEQNWSIVFALNALIYVVGATAFMTLYDSKQEFE